MVRKDDKLAISQDELLIRLFDEVEHAWPKLGYPPLVTPFSQYVKNVSLMNAMQQIKGKDRWTMMDENTWGMILGQSGKLLGPIDPEILNLANQQEREFFTGNPQDLYPDELDKYKTMMDEKGWEYGDDDEELFEYAMHPVQYENYRSGKAKSDFLEDLEKRKQEKLGANNAQGAGNLAPQKINVDVDGKTYEVALSWGEDTSDNKDTNAVASTASTADLKEIVAPLEGKFFLTRDSADTAIKVGDHVNVGDTVAYIESMKVINAIISDKAGVVVEITPRHGDDVFEDDAIIKLS